MTFKKKKKGAKAYFKGTCTLILFGVLVIFGWIPGVIWLIFFRKKTAPEKRKKYTIIISIASVLSFFIMLGYLEPADEESDLPINTEISTESETIFETETSEIMSEIESELPETEENSEEIIAENTQEDTSTNQPTSEQSFENNQPIESQQPIENQEPVQNQQPVENEEPIQEPQQTVKVWISKSGSKYHNDPDCSNMSNPSLITLEEAQSRGKEPCKKCY